MLQGVGGSAAQTPCFGGDVISAAQTKRWMVVAGKLALSPAQRQSLLDMRSCQHVRLAELERLRRELCMQVCPLKGRPQPS